MKTRSQTGSLPKPIERFGEITEEAVKPIKQAQPPTWTAERLVEINALADKRQAEFLAKAMATWDFGPRRSRQTLSEEQVIGLLDYTKRQVAKWGQLDQTYAEGAEDCDIIETGIKRFLAANVRKIRSPPSPLGQTWKEPDRLQTCAFVELKNGKQAQQNCCLMSPEDRPRDQVGMALQARQAPDIPSLLLDGVSENIQKEWIELTEEA